MLIKHLVNADSVRKEPYENTDNLRGSMENSGQEKDAAISERFGANEEAWKNGYHEGRAQMREEAIKACEKASGSWSETCARSDCAAAIRALKP